MYQWNLRFYRCRALYIPTTIICLHSYLPWRAGTSFYSPFLSQRSSHTVSGTWFALTKRLLHEHCPPASGTPNLIIPLTSESLYSLPAWQGDLNPQHGDWLQLQGCVRDRSPGKCAGAWRRRTQGVAPGGVGSAGVRSGGVRSAGVRASAAQESGQNCLVSLLEWG